MGIKHGYGCPYHYGPINFGPPGGDDFGDDCRCKVCAEFEDVTKIIINQKPAVRVDNWLLFPGGKSRKLRIKERYQLWRGKKLVANLSNLTTRIN